MGGENHKLLRYSSRVWAPLQLSCHPRPPRISTAEAWGGGGGGWGGGANPFRINTSPLMEPGGGKSPHTATQFRDAT